MTPLVAYLLAAMTTWVPVSAHASFEPRVVTEARYAAIASDVATAAIELPAVDGDPARTALVLASIASYESSFSARVDECRVAGGRRGERAWSLWQVEGARVELCASRLTAARVALGIVAESVSRCHAPAFDVLSFYALGRCDRSEKARWRWERAHTRWVAHVFDVGDGA